MPLAASFIDLDPAKDKLCKGVFKGSWYTVLANIYGVPRSDIEQRDRTRKKRQRRVITALVVGIIAVLAGALILALISRKEAVSQRELAEKARNDAEGLIEFMVFDLRDKLEPIGRLDLLDSVNQRVNDYYQSMATENPSPDILRRQSVALVNNGDVLFAQGRLDDALSAFTSGKDISDKLAAKDPTKKWTALRVIQELLNTREKSTLFPGVGE